MMFQRYGLVTNEAKTQAEKFQQVLNKGLDGFKLQQDGINETIKGVEQLKNSWGDFKESFAEAIAGGGFWSGIIDKLRYGIENLDLFFAQYMGPIVSGEWGKTGTNAVREYHEAIQREWEARDKKFKGDDLSPEDVISKAKPSSKKESEFGDMAGDGVRRGGGSGESRFLTMRAGSPIDRTAENTRKMAEMQGLSLRTLNLIYDVLSRGGSVRDVEYGRGYKSYGAATSFS